MRKRNHYQYKVFNIFAMMLILFSLVSPGLVNAESTGKLYQSVNGSQVDSEVKVSDRLLNQFKKNDKITFLIKFKEKADTTKVAKAARADASKINLTAYKSEYIQRSAVVSELKATSLTTQASVIDFLEQEAAKGNVDDFHSYYIVNGIAVTATKEVAEKIAAFNEVEKVLPNETRQLITTVSEDAETPKSQVENVEWNVERVGAPAVWDQGIDGTGTVVASIDTGVEWDHPALIEKYRGYDAETGEVDHTDSWFDATAGVEEPYDDLWHGTHVTGTMVGSEPDGSNHIGVAPGAQWIAVKAFSEEGGTDADLLEAAEWILAPGGDIEKAPDVVNNSWSGGPGLDEWYRDVVNTWRDAEIFPEFSAGNTDFFNPGGPGSIANPANYPEAFATGATDVNDKLANFSLVGPSPYDEVKPDVSAPGVNIRSAVPGGYEGGWNGTSMAGPAVSAVVALLKQADASLTVSEIEEILLATAIPLTDSKYPQSPNNGYGYGLVNAYDAVASLTTGLGNIEGQVTIAGEDTAQPTYKHKAPTEAYERANLELKIKVSDNISVLLVELKYKDSNDEWQTTEASRLSGDFKSGEYVATIPGDSTNGESVTYQWVIKDFGNNKVTSDEYVVKVVPGITVGYSTDFETDAAGWTVFGQNNSWERGVPLSVPSTVPSGENVYATNLTGPYKSNSNTTLMMPPIDLPEGAAYLQFDHWHSLEYYDEEFAFDFGHVFISTDQKEWTELLLVQGYSDDWETAEIDLSEYSGERVYIGFTLTSDGSVEDEGWYIDDVMLSDTSIHSLIEGKGNKDASTNTESTKKIPEKAKVNPAELRPAMFKMDNSLEKQANKPSLLPLGAQVTVLESGRSTATNPANGRYKLSHSAGEFTVQAEAYGYHAEQQTVTIAKDGTSEADFTLEELDKYNVSGAITDEVTGEPIGNATLLLIEDANITPVKTDAEGKYTLTAYEGTYTLKVLARDYHSKEVEISLNGKDAETNVTLKPFYSYPGDEIGYDNGTPEDAYAFFEAGNGFAVKMSLAEGKKSAIVTDGVFQFWDTEFPQPGGTEFAVEVWDATGPDGTPGEKLAGPIKGEAIRSLEEQTVVDLSENGIVVDGDFYMVYIQNQPDTLAPALGTDLDGVFSDRNYVYVDGTWEKTTIFDGNFMIRARVNYEVEAPVISTPVDGLITNETTITVEGKASPTTTVQLFNDEAEVGSVEIGADGRFAMPADLTEGKNVFTAVTSKDGNPIEESSPVKVILDTELPELTIDNPKDGYITNRETVKVEGTVADTNLDFVELNGKEIAVTDGSYSERIIVENGENEIKVVAADKAGNVQTESVNIVVDQDVPVIENLTPSADQYVLAGEKVGISFTSDTKGGDASFSVKFPVQSSTKSNNKLVEVKPGVYKGSWTVPSVDLENVSIEVELTDAAGNTVKQEVPGKLFISSKNLERISGHSRYDTAIEISKKGFKSAETVVLTRGDNFADALAGVPLAHKLEAPILMTPSKDLWDDALKEMERLGAKEVVILGGSVAVSDNVLNELKREGLDVRRIEGHSRFDTAAQIASEVSPNGAAEVVIANGMDFPDALSVAAHAAKEGLPILLTKKEVLPEATEDAIANLKAKESIVIGGELAVSKKVEALLPKAKRLSGHSRYETNVAINEYFGVESKHLYVATGQNYADALTGGVLAAKDDSAILLVHDEVPEVVSAYITEKKLKRLTIFGGDIAVSEDVVNDLQKLLP